MIESNPHLYPVLVKDARRANMKRFPYGIWFKVEVDPVTFACLHHRRNPALIKGRTLNPIFYQTAERAEALLLCRPAESSRAPCYKGSPNETEKIVR